MLSRGAIGAPQAGHADVRGWVTDCCRGQRWIGTLAKEPSTRPEARTGDEQQHEVRATGRRSASARATRER